MGILEFDKFGKHTSQDEMIKSWDNTGLLSGLNKTMKKKVAIALEKCAVYLLANDGKYNDVEWSFDTFIFPSIRRIMSDIYENKISAFAFCNKQREKELKKLLLNDLDIEYIANMLYANYVPISKVVENMFSENISNIDVEAESVYHFSKMISYSLCKRKVDEFKYKIIS